MKIQQLRYFAEIARQGSLSRAAQYLSVAQPALSLSIRNLESELGVKLLNRHPKGIELSEQGERLYEQAARLLEQFDNLKQNIKNAPSTVSGQVRLCISGSLSSTITAPLLQHILEHYPGIELIVRDAMSSEAAAMLRSGGVHLALIPDGFEVQGVKTLAVFHEQLTLYRCSGSPPDLPDPLPFASLAGLPLALPDRTHNLRQLVERAAAEAAVVLNVRYELNSPAMLCAVVKGGLACAIMPSSACADAIQAGSIIGTEITDPVLTRTQALVWPENHPLSAAGAKVRDSIRQIIHKLHAQGVLTGALPDCAQSY